MDKFGMNAYNHFKTEQEAAIFWTKLIMNKVIM